MNRLIFLAWSEKMPALGGLLDLADVERLEGDLSPDHLLLEHLI